MKKIKAIIGVLLSISLLAASLSTVNAVSDDPMISASNSLLSGNFGASGTAEYSHNERFSAGYDIADVIDVSVHNGDIDWNAVKADGISNVLIRAGYRGNTYGGLNPDDRFVSNINSAIAVGLNVGVYFYTQAVSVAEAVEEADYTLSLINGYNLRLPVVYDCEFASGSNGPTGRFYEANLSKSTITEMCLAFCNRVKAAGYDGMVYANANMLKNNMYADQISASYPIWLAHYTEKTDYPGEYLMWQFTSKGSVNGITGNVDRSFIYVKQGSVVPEPLKLTVAQLDLVIGTNERINSFIDYALLSSAGGTISDVTWQSSAPEFLTVEAGGVVTAVAEGSATISAVITVTNPTSDRGTTESVYTDSLTISAIPKPPEPVIPQFESGGWSSVLTGLINLFVQFVSALLGLIKGFSQ
ncbi:MAG: Ig-like domain-containing protein [Clostridia bacterium]|nr:Ig-like domain-containing protein [Clostridia bacterium]